MLYHYIVFFFAVPLLDQPTIVEGSRNRKTVVQFESKVTVTKFSPVEIPKGKGTPLGRIPNINGRMKVNKLQNELTFNKLTY